MIKLKYKGVFDIPDGEGSCVITLTDEGEKKALSIMTHRALALRLKAYSHNRKDALRSAVGVLAYILEEKEALDQYHICIDAKKDLGFNARLENELDDSSLPISPDEAVLLALVAGMDMFATVNAFQFFATPYSENAHMVALPILGLPDSMLKKALDKAVEEENYETASYIRDEMKRREQKHREQL